MENKGKMIKGRKRDKNLYASLYEVIVHKGFTKYIEKNSFFSFLSEVEGVLNRQNITETEMYAILILFIKKKALPIDFAEIGPFTQKERAGILLYEKGLEKEMKISVDLNRYYRNIIDRCNTLLELEVDESLINEFMGLPQTTHSIMKYYLEFLYVKRHEGRKKIHSFMKSTFGIEDIGYHFRKFRRMKKDAGMGNALNEGVKGDTLS